LLSFRLLLNPPDEPLAAAISLLQNVTWLSLSIHNGAGACKTLAALEAIPDLRKLTLRLRSSYDAFFHRLTEAHGNRITALYLYFDRGYINEPKMFLTIRDKLPRLTTLHVVAARGSSIDALLLDDKPWACQDALTSIHFQELTELEASLIPKMVDRFRNVRPTQTSSSL
jgi:hypothetical protein